jgi:TonB family protein
VDLSKLTPPPIPASDLPPAVKKAAETKPAVKPAPAQPTRPQPETPVVQQPQQQPVQTAQQQAPAPPTPPPAVPKPAVPTPQQTSNTAINGWDPNLPETKPAPAQPQAAPPDAKSVDFMPPKVLLQVMPNTRAITPGSITEVTRVDVEVAIDRLGHVKSAHVTSANVKSQLATAAVTAAKAWTFQPATLRGQTVDSDHTIRFEFRPEGQ